MCVSAGKEPDKGSLFLDPREYNGALFGRPCLQNPLPVTFIFAAHSLVSLGEAVAINRVAEGGCVDYKTCLPTHKTNQADFILKSQFTYKSSWSYLIAFGLASC